MNSNWKKLTKNQKNRLCRFETKDEIDLKRDNTILQSIIDKYNLVDYSAFDVSHPVAFVLSEGTNRTQRNNPENRKRFVDNYLIENPRLLDYPLVDHADYFRTQDKKTYLISHTYLSQEEISASIEKIRLLKGYENLKFYIEEESFYSPNALCVVIWI